MSSLIYVHISPIHNNFFTMSSVEHQSPDHAVPGTVQLVDIDHTLNVRHAGNGDVILVPAPTDDPEDPLNWSPRRKLLSTVCITT
jgi:hypothetical protein